MSFNSGPLGKPLFLRPHRFFMFFSSFLYLISSSIASYQEKVMGLLRFWNRKPNVKSYIILCCVNLIFAPVSNDEFLLNYIIYLDYLKLASQQKVHAQYIQYIIQFWRKNLSRFLSVSPLGHQLATVPSYLRYLWHLEIPTPRPP